MKKPVKLQKTSGFTLVELMVVIVIIAALFGIGAMAAMKIQKSSRLTGSVQKVRDLGVRVAAYTTDHNGELPVYHNTTTNLYWWGNLVEDPKNKSQLTVFKSPNHKEFDLNRVDITISYGWNGKVVGMNESDDSSGYGPKRLANFSDPSRIMVLADGPAKNGRGLIDAQTAIPDSERYGGKVAALILDGSAKTLNVEGDLKPSSPWWQGDEKH
jgi:prepilin-type N-terminal cleavage/methylation domain-containing protein